MTRAQRERTLRLAAKDDWKRLKERAARFQADGVQHLYLSGKMAGLPEHGRPLFHAHAAQLRRLGFKVTSPAELPGLPEVEESKIVGGDEVWQQFLKRDLIIVCDGVDGVAVLPRWRDSRGARLETYTAAVLGLEIFHAPSLIRVDRATIQAPELLLDLPTAVAA